MISPEPPRPAVDDAVARALAEDLLPMGDITASLIPAGAGGRADVMARQEGVLAGTSCAAVAFAHLDQDVEVVWAAGDGDPLSPGTLIGSIEGPLRPIVSAERTALNFLCHLSGIATLTRRFVDAVASANPSTAVWDTRKTTPGLRSLEKAAVRAGGGRNHRGSLSEGVLIKDNHLVGLGVKEAVKLALSRWPGRLVEVECDTATQVAEAVEAGAPVVMLDNMDPGLVRDCVSIVRRKAGHSVLVEVSGGVTLDNAPAFAAAGADLVSVGALTHSATALDIGLDVRA